MRWPEIPSSPPFELTTCPALVRLCAYHEHLRCRFPWGLGPDALADARVCLALFGGVRASLGPGSNLLPTLQLPSWCTQKHRKLTQTKREFHIPTDPVVSKNSNDRKRLSGKALRAQIRVV